MKSKSNNGYYTCAQTDVENNPYKKTTYKKHKSVLAIKYSLIFSGIITLILMVIFGINNVATQFNTNSTDPTVVFNTTLVTNSTKQEEITEKIQQTELSEQKVTNSTKQEEITEKIHPKATLDMLESGEDSNDDVITTPQQQTVENDTDVSELSTTTEQESKDVVIANKTVIINGSNDSVIVTP